MHKYREIEIEISISKIIEQDFNLYGELSYGRIQD